MGNEQYQSGKIKLIFSKGQVEKSGEILRKSSGDTDWAIEVIRNYRAAHLYPLMIIKNLVWKHARKVTPDATIARRLKRLPTIIHKLQRATLDGNSTNSINLKRMQDIGGCRVIVNNKKELIELNRSLSESRTIHETVRTKDYIESPKQTGYRGIHRIYKCYSKKESHDWKGFFIEVQLRTKLQHLWATTVEVVDLCEKQTIKTNPVATSKGWSEFFFIMSEFLAEEDGFIHLSNIQKAIYKETLNKLDTSLNAYNKLASFNAVFSNKDISIKAFNNGYALLIIDGIKGRVAIELYSKDDEKTAIERYGQEENDPNNNALLVGIDDVKSLKTAYPNYLVDTRKFTERLRKYINSVYWIQNRGPRTQKDLV
ncbi:RelA/SpoT domain-containing protein [Limnobaculum parvum]|uniref:(P)ppGpp synthetase n=1 Tax=Limnobaculum parvum TaxID=2172103 RepID=A0A2Y9U2I4_9GAMM|nr:RelA/SpoT domain-containing protein [Limnobaculum parvum]AWH90030.1 (p)ppGpp synthetase [Limnobaculum parvum]